MLSEPFKIDLDKKKLKQNSQNTPHRNETNNSLPKFPYKII
jgi:hypothetical protein